jgi:hypothetical protein
MVEREFAYGKWSIMQILDQQTFLLWKFSAHEQVSCLILCPKTPEGFENLTIYNVLLSDEIKKQTFKFYFRFL